MNFLYKLLRALKYKNIFFFKTLILLRQKLSGRLISKEKNGIILNCGGPRSGSTLLNMIIKEILVARLSSEENYLDNPNDFSDKLSNYKHYSLVKTHRYFSNISRLIKKGQVIAFMTHRDIRDVTLSLVQTGWVKDIDLFIKSKDLKQIEYTSIAYAKTNGITIFSYEQLMQSPQQVVISICEKLDIHLSNRQINRILDSVSKDSVSKKINRIKVNRNSKINFDKSTGLHKGHINDGRSGKWRKLLDNDQAKKITNECIEYIELFKYDSQ